MIKYSPNLENDLKMVKEDEESVERLTTQVAKKATSDDVFKEIGEFGK